MEKILIIIIVFMFLISIGIIKISNKKEYNVVVSEKDSTFILYKNDKYVNKYKLLNN